MPPSLPIFLRLSSLPSVPGTLPPFTSAPGVRFLAHALLVSGRHFRSQLSCSLPGRPHLGTCLSLCSLAFLSQLPSSSLSMWTDLLTCAIPSLSHTVLERCPFQHQALQLATTRSRGSVSTREQVNWFLSTVSPGRAISPARGALVLPALICRRNYMCKCILTVLP